MKDFDERSTMPWCNVCYRRKKPIGRDSRDNGLCDHECEGYTQPPLPNDKWTDENTPEKIVAWPSELLRCDDSITISAQYEEAKGRIWIDYKVNDVLPVCGSIPFDESTLQALVRYANEVDEKKRQQDGLECPHCKRAYEQETEEEQQE